mmetsp:Transcript_33687/g.52412  ORF Transcript_33687/g.52412 Transcript_33687/m.52412 type:complete len:219 (-) Transcript_33687:1526-2182(-)
MAQRHPDTTFILTDLAPDMVEKAEKFSAKLPNVTARVADAQDLSEFPNNHFDAVVCCYGFMFLPEKEKGFAEVYRTLKPGGLLITTVWKEVTMMKMVREMMEAVLGEAPPAPPINPMALSKEGLLEDYLKGAKLRIEHTENSTYPFNFGSELDIAFKMCTMVIKSFIDEQVEKGNVGAADTVRQVFDRWLKEEQVINLKGEFETQENTFMLAVARKAA